MAETIQRGLGVYNNCTGMYAKDTYAQIHMLGIHKYMYMLGMHYKGSELFPLSRYNPDVRSHFAKQGPHFPSVY